MNTRKQISENMFVIRKYMALIEIELQMIQGVVEPEKQEVITNLSGLDKRTISRLFAGIRGWDEDDWLNKIDNGTKTLWIKDAMVKRGTKGIGGESLYNPAILVRNAIHKNFNNATIDRLNAIFEDNISLIPWVEEWKQYCPARQEIRSAHG